MKSTYERPNAIIHIGPMKTGSTSFQTFVIDHQAILNTKHNFFWPQGLEENKRYPWKSLANFSRFFYSQMV